MNTHLGGTHRSDIFPLPLPLVHPSLRVAYVSSRRVQQRLHFSAFVIRQAAVTVRALNKLFSPSSSAPLYFYPSLSMFSLSSAGLHRVSPSVFDTQLSSAQRRVLARVLSSVSSFFRLCRRPTEGLASGHLSDPLTSVSSVTDFYHSASAAAVPIISHRVALPSAPPTASLLDLLPPHLASLYSAPTHLMSPSLVQQQHLPHTRLLGSRVEYARLVRRMLSLNLVSFTRSPRVVNGAFCVPKADSDDLRLIVDARPANSLFITPPSVRLPSPEFLSRLVVSPSSRLYAGKTDLSAFYHCLRMPVWLQPFFALPSLLPSELGLSGLGSEPVFPCCTTVPMGFSHAVFLAQAVHERLLSSLPSLTSSAFLSSSSDFAVNRLRVLIYIDDVVWFDVHPHRMRTAMGEYESACTRAGLSINTRKTVLPSLNPLVALGFLFDPRRRIVRLHPQHTQTLIRTTQVLLSSPTVFGSDLSVVVGKWVWACMVARPSLSVLQSSFAFSTRYFRRSHALWPSVRNELSLLCALAPLLFSHLPSPPSPSVPSLIATDASLLGGAVMSSSPSPSFVSSVLSSPLHFSSDSVTSPLAQASPPQSSPVLFLPSPSVWRPSAQRAFHTLTWRKLFRFRWKVQKHINELEVQTILIALSHLLSRPLSVSTSPALFSDSTVALSVLIKGRSSSFPLLRLCRRVAAVCLAGGIRPLYFWIPSAHNPADSDSRFLDAS